MMNEENKNGYLEEATEGNGCFMIAAVGFVVVVLFIVVELFF
jgi:uncharacterized protein (DUF983 family)